MERFNQLVSYLQDNQLDYFDEFYEISNKLVYHTIISIIKRRDIAEDLMQDTYMKFLQNINSCDVNSYPKAYLVQIARNLTLNELNKTRRVELNEEFVDNYSNDIDDDKVDIGIIDYLDGIEKDIVTYHIVLNLKFKDIAIIVDRSLGTVLWLYKRAINKLKKKVVDNNEK